VGPLTPILFGLTPRIGRLESFLWNDDLAKRFLTAHYPWFLRTYLTHPHDIQRADSLRYFLLYHYGGIYLDFDLTCRRSLGPLRRYHTLAISAHPAGVSNGFLTSSPRHPFYSNLIQQLTIYDLSWPFSSYATIMFSTGPMFISAEHLRFRPRWIRRNQLRVLDRLHSLNGKISTPLFHHAGSSSWHSKSLVWIRHVPGRIGWIVFCLAVLIGLIVGVIIRCLTERSKKESTDSEVTIRLMARCETDLAAFDSVEDEALEWEGILTSE